MNLRPYKARKLLAAGILGLFLVYAIFLNVAAGLTSEYANYVAEDLGEADYPEEEFDEFFQRNEIENNSEMVRFLERREDLSGLQKRITLHGFALADIGYTLPAIVANAESDTDKPGLEGSFYRKCLDSPNATSCSREVYYLNFIGLNLKFANQAGSIEKVFNTTSKRERIESFVERATYYDKTLNTAYQPTRIIAAVYSEDSDLYLITRNSSNVRIDGERYSVNDTVTRLNISLEEGRHRIQTGNRSVEFPVYHEPPSSILEGNSIMLRNRTGKNDFREVTASRQNWSRTVRLRENGSEIEVPDRFVFTEETPFGTDTKIRPVKLNWSNENVYLVNRVGNGGYRETDYKYGFGMSREEFEEISSIQEVLGNLPLSDRLVLFGSLEWINN